MNRSKTVGRLIGLVVVVSIETAAGCQAVVHDERWPDVPEGASTLVYVDWQADPLVADGSPDAPFVRIGDALEGAGDGEAILVASGEYAESVVFDRERLPGRLFIVGIPGVADDPFRGTMIVPPEGGGGIMVIGPGGGVPERVNITGISVDGGSGYGVWVVGSSAELRSVAVRAVESSESWRPTVPNCRVVRGPSRTPPAPACWPPIP
jgi:hypothetical protein